MEGISAIIWICHNRNHNTFNCIGAAYEAFWPMGIRSGGGRVLFQDRGLCLAGVWIDEAGLQESALRVVVDLMKRQS